MARYTAYHLYQTDHYADAQRANAGAYKSAAYQCPHSQQGFLGGYGSYAQRQQNDAPNTSCCGQKIEMFGTNRQYEFGQRPPASTDCEALDAQVGCTILNVGPQGHVNVCANEAPAYNFVVRCAASCADMQELKAMRSISKTYGTLFYDAQLNPNDANIRYVIHQSLLDNLYNYCLGSQLLYESFCGGKFVINITAYAGYGSPEGCYCNCCYVPPTLVVSGGTFSATYANAATPSGVTRGESACAEGSLAGNWNGSYGPDVAVPWTDGPTFCGDVVNRYWEGTPGAVGSAGSPVCCGGTLTWSGTSGCGASDTDVKTIAKNVSGTPVITSDKTPTGTVFYDNQDPIKFTATQICSTTTGRATAANLTYATSCLATTWGAVQNMTGYLDRTASAITLLTSGTCNRCCGYGTLDVTATDGCGGSAVNNYQVQKVRGSGTIGYQYHCALYYGSYYVWKRTIACANGALGTDAVDGGAYPSLTDCVNAINQATDSYILAQCAGTPCGTCCRYMNNNGSGTGFLAELLCSSSSTQCCQWGSGSATLNKAWVRGSSSTCCPHET